MQSYNKCFQISVLLEWPNFFVNSTSAPILQQTEHLGLKRCCVDSQYSVMSNIVSSGVRYNWASRSRSDNSCVTMCKFVNLLGLRHFICEREVIIGFTYLIGFLWKPDELVQVIRSSSCWLFSLVYNVVSGSSNCC